MIHRGAQVAATESKTIRTQQMLPREGWIAVVPLDYPAEQEE